MPVFSGIDRNKNVIHSSTVNSNRVAPIAEVVADVPVARTPPVVREPVIERGVIRKITGHGAFATPSILDALKDKPDNGESSGAVKSNVTNSRENTKDQPFSQQELIEAWKIFAGTIDTPQMKVALSAREPHLLPGFQVEYELDTELQYNRLTLEFKPSLLGYLRRHLKNESVEIQFKISESDDNHTSTPYTDGERWNSLVEKYPALAALKSKFGLDFEHF